jgi:hypothetical protein
MEKLIKDTGVYGQEKHKRVTSEVPLELPDDARIEVGPDRAARSLAPKSDKGTYDPFDKFKTDPENYYYYAVNAKHAMLREERIRQGFELINDATHGDLVLGRIPRERHEEMEKKEKQKAKDQLRAPKEQYKEEAKRLGVPVEE